MHAHTTSAQLCIAVSHTKIAQMEAERSTDSVQGKYDVSSVEKRNAAPWGLYLQCRRAYIVTVEPVVFLFMFGVYLMLFTSQQYFFWRYGSEALARNGTPSVNGCISAHDLGHQLVVEVQKSSSRLLSYVFVPGQVMCIFTALVLGPLSDTFGRKFIFYLVGTGVIVQGLVSLIVILLKLDMRFLIVGGVLSGFFGGFASILAASFAYAADVSSPGRGRSIRISIIEAAIYVAGLVAEGGAGKVLEQLNCSFWPLIAVYIGSGLLMILYTALFLPEPFSRSERLQRAADSPKGVGRLLRGLKIFFCPSNYSTWKLWAALGALVIISGNFVGTQTITAIFQEGSPLKWGPATIGYYAMVAMATHGIVTLFILPILVALSLPDILIAIIGVLFSGGMDLFTGFVHHTWEMFLIGTVSAVEAVIAPSVRSFMSKVVSAGDQGAMFAFVASAELLATSTATAFYPNIFPVLLSHNLRPGSVYFIMAALCSGPLLLLIVLLIATRHMYTWLCCRVCLSSRDSMRDSDGEKKPLLNNHTPTAGTMN